MPDNNIEEPQGSLFGDLDQFTIQKQEWGGMPEFSQKKIEPFKVVYLKFESQADIDDFCELTKLKILPTTKYVWFPEITIEKYMDKRYVDEEPEQFKCRTCGLQKNIDYCCENDTAICLDCCSYEEENF